MIHNDRVFFILRAHTPKELANKLMQPKVPLCSGFYHGGFLYLNDSPSEEEGRKFAVMKTSSFPKPGRWELDQVETMELKEMTREKALEFVNTLKDAQPYKRVVVNLDGPGHRCPLCS